jgi:putative glutamine amidotransferase
LLDIIKLSTMQVNTFHHQAVKEVAFGFRASAIAHDGVIEGIEGINHRFVIGVQFHPELMWQNNPSITALFGAFVSEAMKYKQQK